jgi:acyl-coenzyme A synthetase/AMP-(fatty) acid ligase
MENVVTPQLEWYQQHIPIPVIDHWWQTESGWPMIANSLVLKKCRNPVQHKSSLWV